MVRGAAAWSFKYGSHSEYYDSYIKPIFHAMYLNTAWSEYLLFKIVL
jgi:hypothetical protein